jgi:hypothetical protein
MLGAVGLLFLALGFLGLGYLALIWALTNVAGMNFGPIGGRPLLAYSVAFTLLGGQAISLGLLAELLVAYTGRESDTYSVAERTGGAKRQEEYADRVS